MKRPRINNNQAPPQPLSLSPCSSGRRTSGESDSPESRESNSPEFEFWNMGRNPSSFPQQNQLISADEIFNGFLRIPNNKPTHHEPKLSKPSKPDPDPNPDPEPGHKITRSTATPSKRWMDIFKKSEKKYEEEIKLEEKKTEKLKKKTKKSGQSGVNSTSAAELNINIWPFRRSRSAGNNTTRLVLGSVTRKVSSAPCSRSNSSGSSRRQWPSSPGRGGVHLGRSSPVWLVKPRGVNNSGKNEVTASRQGKTKVMNFNVPLPPMCVGYSQHLSCRRIETGAIDVGEISSRRSRIGGEINTPGNLFNLRSFFFNKKVY